MQIAVRDPGKSDLKYDLLVYGIRRRGDHSPPLEGVLSILDKQHSGWISKTIRREDFKGKKGETRLLSLPAVSGNLLIVGLGDRPDPDMIRRLGALAVRQGNKVRAEKIGIEAPKISPTSPVQLLTEGVTLGNYSFDRYKSSENLSKKTVSHVDLLISRQRDVEREILIGRLSGEATNFARDLINIPASEMTPRRMGEEAKKIAKQPRLSLKLLDRRACEKIGMGAFLAVARGSVEPPCFIHLIYRPAGKPQGRIALVGKGITFDSGGLSLKTAQGMETMKDDMSGAATVLAIFRALPELQVPYEVHGIAAVTENMPSGSADKPGDVAKTLCGKTIEILNTDAEGRLTLADAIPYAIRQKPDLVIDLATLTGACVVALGELCSGVMGNDQRLIDRLIASGRVAGEKIWQLPLIEEYKEEIKSSVADLKNVGGKGGGTITAGLFLQEFVTPKVPWAHIDIAGPSWTEKETDLCPRGGTGVLVRTLIHFLLEKKIRLSRSGMARP